MWGIGGPAARPSWVAKGSKGGAPPRLVGRGGRRFHAIAMTRGGGGMSLGHRSLPSAPARRILVGLAADEPEVRMATVVLTVNGAKRKVEASPEESLLSLLRNRLDLTAIGQHPYAIEATGPLTSRVGEALAAADERGIAPLAVAFGQIDHHFQD